MARPCAPQEAVLRVRRLIENRKTLAKLEYARRVAEEQSEGNRADLRVLREDLRRNAILLQRAVEFHRRLSPTGDRVVVRMLLGWSRKRAGACPAGSPISSVFPPVAS